MSSYSTVTNPCGHIAIAVKDQPEVDEPIEQLEYPTLHVIYIGSFIASSIVNFGLVEKVMYELTLPYILLFCLGLKSFLSDSYKRYFILTNFFLLVSQVLYAKVNEPSTQIVASIIMNGVTIVSTSLLLLLTSSEPYLDQTSPGHDTLD